jgi:hypothetical protein
MDMCNLRFSHRYIPENYSFHPNGNSWINNFLPTLNHTIWIAWKACKEVGPKSSRRPRKLDCGLLGITCGVKIKIKYATCYMTDGTGKCSLVDYC